MQVEEVLAGAIERLNSGDLTGAEATLVALGFPSTLPMNLNLVWGLLRLRQGQPHEGLRLLDEEIRVFPHNETARSLHALVTAPTGSVQRTDTLSPKLANAAQFENRYDMLSIVPTGGVVVEVGVLDGGFSRVLLERLQPKKLYLIDPWLYASRDDATEVNQSEQDVRYISVYQSFHKEIAAGRVELIRAKSTDANSLIADNSIDFFYVDGDHTHEAARNDIELARTKTKVGGLIAIDDYAVWWPGVFETVNDMLRTCSGDWCRVEAVTANRGSSENILLRRMG